jgi:hypothetical protein
MSNHVENNKSYHRYLVEFIWTVYSMVAVRSAIKPDDIATRMHLNPYGNSDSTPDMLQLKGWVNSLLAGSTQNKMRRGG